MLKQPLYHFICQQILIFLSKLNGILTTSNLTLYNTPKSINCLLLQIKTLQIRFHHQPPKILLKEIQITRLKCFTSFRPGCKNMRKSTLIICHHLCLLEICRSLKKARLAWQLRSDINGVIILMIVIELVYLIGLIVLILAGFYWLLCTKTNSSKDAISDSSILKKDDQVIIPDDTDQKKSQASSVCYEMKEKLSDQGQRVEDSENYVKDGKLLEMYRQENDHQDNQTQAKKQQEEIYQKQVSTNIQPLKESGGLSSIEQSNSYVEANSQQANNSIHSSRYQIHQRAISRKQRQRKRLEAVKNHYKKIIEGLHYKLEQVCQRNNLSISLAELNETINFTEEDSVISYQAGEEKYFLEVKTEQINNLKQQLQFHEECVTNLLQEDQALKEKLKNLEEQNKKLKVSMINPTQKIDQIKQQKVERRERTQDILIKQEHNSPKNMSPIKKIYASQIIPNSPLYRQSIPIFGSGMGENTSPSRLSTISMMSIVEGAMSIGLLGECRSLNEINKKFIINEVKKTIKKRIVDAELIYSTNDEDSGQTSFPRGLYLNENILVLIKLSNGRGIGIFAQTIQPQNKNQIIGPVAIFNLSKRKGNVYQTKCVQTLNSLIIGNDDLSIGSTKEHTMTVKGTGDLLGVQGVCTDLFGNDQETQVIEHLDIFVLYPSQ